MNKDKFDRIYNDVLSYWPPQIDVREKTLFGDGAANIPNLANIHDKIEETLENSFSKYTTETSEYIDWCIYTLIHGVAQRQSCDTIYTYKVDREEILKLALENEEYLSDWKGDNPHYKNKL